MAAENRFVVFVLGIEGILKDNATTQKRSKNVVKLFNNYNLLTICLIIYKNLRVIATSYKQRATNCQVFLLTLHSHKQQLTFLQRFKLIGLYPA